jgi:polysaccharide export outer membrane protein
MMCASKCSVAVVLGLSLCACAAETRLDPSATAVGVASTLPPPDSPTVAVDIAPYHVVPGDELVISVFGAPDLERTGKVDAAGDFAMPLAGTVHVGGKTPDEISDLIEAKLRGPYLKDPRVAVNVKEALNQQTITVDGEVQQPGVYPVGGRLSLQQAVALARGASETANIRNVIVFRTVNNQKMAAMFDLKEIRSGRSPDPPIYGNDIVVVGEDGVQKFLRGSTYLFPVLGRFIPFVF